jgi:hypothetical protein
VVFCARLYDGLDELVILSEAKDLLFSTVRDHKGRSFVSLKMTTHQVNKNP